MIRVGVVLLVMLFCGNVWAQGEPTPGTYPFTASAPAAAQPAAVPPKTDAGKTAPAPQAAPQTPLDLPLGPAPAAGTPGVPNAGGPALPLPGTGGKTPKPKKIDYDFGVAKDAPVTGRPLPPVGTLPDGMMAVNPTVIHATDGVAYEVRVSRWMPNRFSTPFRNPKVVDSSGAQIQTVNSDVFVLPSGDAAFVVYVLEGAPSPGVRAPTLSLVLIPQERLPAQNIVVTFDAGIRDTAPKGPSDVPYVRHIKEVFREIVRGNTPQGFVRSKFDGRPIAVMGGAVDVAPLEYYSGTNMMIVVYALRNSGSSSVEINEESFYRERVRAVALYPNTILLPGQESRLYVMVDVPGGSGQ